MSWCLQLLIQACSKFFNYLTKQIIPVFDKAQSDDFPAIFNLEDYKASRERSYKQIEAAVAKYQEIKKKINEGLKFYVSLQEAITLVKQQCSDFVITVNLQCTEMINNVQRKLAGLSFQESNSNGYSFPPVSQPQQPPDQGHMPHSSYYQPPQHLTTASYLRATSHPTTASAYQPPQHPTTASTYQPPQHPTTAAYAQAPPYRYSLPPPPQYRIIRIHRLSTNNILNTGKLRMVSGRAYPHHTTMRLRSKQDQCPVLHTLLNLYIRPPTRVATADNDCTLILYFLCPFYHDTLLFNLCLLY